ncbi:AMP-binding protein [Aurantivibrio plasticivorans]
MNLHDVLLKRSNDIVLNDGKRSLTASEMITQANRLGNWLHANNIRCVGLYGDNSADWVIADYACLYYDIAIVPLPTFFSNQQLTHAIHQSGVDCILTDQPLLIDNLDIVGYEDSKKSEQHPVLSQFSYIYPKPNKLDEALPRIPKGTQKITFTSGTTGSPKGVCLSSDHLLQVAQSLTKMIGIRAPRHLCILPLSTLLENLAGIYVPWLSDGTVFTPSLSEVGLSGSSQLDLGKLLASIEKYQPHSIILTPELLTALTAACDLGWQAPRSLQFIAVGGGNVSKQLLVHARKHELPVYQGYGLSECGSVVSLNTPSNNLIDSVGKPLPHVKVNIRDREVIVKGSCFLGYCNEPKSWYPREVMTGDIGSLDDADFLSINGRKKHLLISSYGRNISPEWIEAELLAGPLLQQCVVVGDNKPYCTALILSRESQTTDNRIQQWINQVNSTLPDYARIKYWHRLDQSLSAIPDLMTNNGRLKRQTIHRYFDNTIEALYPKQENAS